MLVKYRERFYPDRYTCYDRYKKLEFNDFFVSGSLLYVKTDSFNYKVISFDDIEVLVYTGNIVAFPKYRTKERTEMVLKELQEMKKWITDICPRN